MDNNHQATERFQLGREVDLLEHYPKSKRDIGARGDQKTESDREIARQFGKAFFDGDRRHGYGGFHYHPRFWEPVIPTLQQFYDLKAGSRVLDVGCAKGFMLFDILRLIPDIYVRGLDISAYAIEQAMPEMKPYLTEGNVTDLPYEDDAFDLVISINTLHNLEGAALAQAFSEVTRVSRQHTFITVDAFRNPEEQEAMLAWNLTAKTIKSFDDWKAYFAEVGYAGDFYWFMP